MVSTFIHLPPPSAVCDNVPVETVDSFTQTFSDDTNFIYNSSLVEFSTGVLQQKSQLPANALIGATYTTTTDLSWEETSLGTTGTLIGSPTIGTGKLSCVGNNGVTYNTKFSEAVSIRFLYTPNYTTTPGVNTDIFMMEGGASSSKFGISHSPTGNSLRVWLKDSSGTAIYTATAIYTFTPTAATEYEMLFVADAAAGKVYIFVDGTLNGTLTTTPWTFGTADTEINIGSGGTYNNANAFFDDLVTYDSTLHSISYTAGYTLPESKYLEAASILPRFYYTGLGDIESYQNITEIVTNNVKYTWNNQWYNGAAWVSSDGTYSQSNTELELLLNVETSTIKNILDITVIFPDSNTNNSIDYLKVDYRAST